MLKFVVAKFVAQGKTSEKFVKILDRNDTCHFQFEQHTELERY